MKDYTRSVLRNSETPLMGDVGVTCASAQVCVYTDMQNWGPFMGDTRIVRGCRDITGKWICKDKGGYIGCRFQRPGRGPFLACTCRL